MLPLSARKGNQGFTLTEVLIIVVIVGILAAIAVPSFLGWYNRQKVNQALTKVQGALKEAQREAIKKSQGCQVKLDTANKEVTAELLNSSGNPTGKSCLVTGDRQLPSGVSMATNISGSPPSTIFSYRGTVTLYDTGKVVLFVEEYKKCLALSSPLGIMRKGNFIGSTSDVTAGTCQKETL